ncbi:MAG: transposase [Planctomycetota bacterium]|nr:transposase [Planctomycetota bacterium]
MAELVTDRFWILVEPLLPKAQPSPKGGSSQSLGSPSFGRRDLRPQNGHPVAGITQGNELRQRQHVLASLLRVDPPGRVAEAACVVAEGARKERGDQPGKGCDRLGERSRGFWGDHTGPNPTDRAKNGTKRSIIVEQNGGPLGVVVARANVHDTKLLEQTIEAIVVERPDTSDQNPQHLCLEKAYDNPTGRAAASAHGHTPHIRRIREEKEVKCGKKSTNRDDG